MADTMQQNEQRSSPLESNPCHSEVQPDDIQSGNTNGHCNDQGSNVSTTPQITPVKQRESCTKTTSGQNLTHAMPVVYPELSMISPFPGQTPVNALDTKLAGVFSICAFCIEHVTCQLNFVVAIVTGPLQSTIVTDSPSNLMESPTATSNAYSNTTISPFCLPTKVKKFVYLVKEGT